jgi:hypothetical protein
VNQNGALISCFDAFSSREPEPTSLENALVLRTDHCAQATFGLLYCQ